MQFTFSALQNIIIPNAYTVGASVHRSILFVYNLAYVYEVRSYADISSIAYRFLVIKQNGDQHLSKIFSIFIPTLIKRTLP